MQPDADDLQILRAVASRPEALPHVAVELAQSARTLVIRALKARGLDLDGLRRLHEALGAKTLAVVAGALTEAETRNLVRRLDGYHPEPAEVEGAWSRRRLLALAAGAAPAMAEEDAAKPARRAAKKAPAPPPVVRRALGSAAFAAVWDGKDHDPKSDHASKPVKTKKAR